jgi:hypothetical protein
MQAMESNRPFRYLAVAFIAVSAAVAASGCTSPIEQRSPERILALTVSGLAAVERVGFNGTTSVELPGGLIESEYGFNGEVIGHAKLSVSTSKTAETKRLNPVAVLEQLQQGNRIIKLDPAASKGKWVTLQIDLDQAKAGEEAASLYRSGFDQAVSAMLKEKKLLSSNKGKNSEAERVMQKEIARSKAELEQMLGTLSVRTHYVLRIDKTRFLPQSLKETSVMTYKSQGRAREERRLTSFTFGSFDGNPVPNRATPKKS